MALTNYTNLKKTNSWKQHFLLLQFHLEQQAVLLN